MWYIFGTAWKRFPGVATPERTYKIGHATSHDGTNWTREEGVQIIPDRLGPDESQALPSVVEIDGAFHMFFCYRESADFRTNAARGYRLGHAVSSDLHSWTRADDQLTFGGDEGAWDSDMQCYPHAFEHHGQVYLLYNGNAFGRDGFGAAVLER
jgi:sucrose-6-phosphate hydrolase SacC (GH32 family)